MNLAALLVRVLSELEASSDAGKRALLGRLREGTYTPRDACDVADMIERVAEQGFTRSRPN